MYVKFSISIPSVLKCIPDKFSEKQNSYLFIYLFIYFFVITKLFLERKKLCQECDLMIK